MNEHLESVNDSTVKKDESLEWVNDSDVKMYAATAMSQTLSFCMERKYLEKIGDHALNPSFSLDEVAQTSKWDVSWIEISRVGKPLKDDAERCFTAMQKILFSCFMPKETQLLFLVISNGLENKMYLGVRPMSPDQPNSNMSRYLNNFIKGTWAGLQTRIVEDNSKDPTLQQFVSNVKEKKWEHIHALTGIPSMESQYKSVYPATIDQLMAGMNQSKGYAYLVVADPIETAEVDKMLYQCREMNGQAESLKSFNLSEGETAGINHSVTDGISTNTTDGTNESVSKKDWSGLKKALSGDTDAGLAPLGLAALASIAFPPAIAAIGAEAGIHAVIGAGALLFGLMPQRTTGTSHSESHGTSHSITDGMSQSQSQTISSNVVNKHIEAVSEILSQHGRRLETGKAIGTWKVGAYLLTERASDAKGGAMQLRSILSGQESIYEPIRITDISNVIKEPDETFGYFQAPILKVDYKEAKGPFEHPLGDNYTELKTVLTTKELSYLINFPLRSVPGISVIDSTPDFSLTPQREDDKSTGKGDKPTLLELGNLVYSGSESNISVKLPLNTLSRHALVCGVNGSGKTNTVLNVLDGFMKAGRPFFVIEPAKTEYVDWAVKYNNSEFVKNDPKKRIKIYIPGCKKYAKAGLIPDELKINPFEVIQLEGGEMRVISHIDRLKSSFAAAFPMQDILPVIMERLLYDLYIQAELLSDEGVENAGGGKFPTLGTVDRKFIDALMYNLGYATDNTRNISAALRTRFYSLKQGWKGELLNNERFTGETSDGKEMTWKDLFSSPVVVNLSYVGDDQDRAFIMSLLMQFLYEYRIAESEADGFSFESDVCRHLVVVEEAHRIMTKCMDPEMPQYKSAQMFSNCLSEVRAYGQGIMIVDQVPSRLIEDAVKNTNVKVIHKLVAADDSKLIAECVGLTEEQQKVIGKLSVGQAVLVGLNSADVGSQDSSEIYLAQINYRKAK